MRFDTVMAIDIATSTGYSVFTHDPRFEDNGRLLTYGKFKFNNLLNTVDTRISEIKDVIKILKDVIDKYRVCIVVIEYIPTVFNRNIKPLRIFDAIFNGILYGMDKDLVDFYLMSVSTLMSKSAKIIDVPHNIFKTNRKKLTVKYVNDKYKLQLKQSEDDIADSIMINECFHNEVKTIGKDVEKYKAFHLGSL